LAKLLRRWAKALGFAPLTATVVSPFFLFFSLRSRRRLRESSLLDEEPEMLATSWDLFFPSSEEGMVAM
jgi:hypothetical protein